MVGYMVPEVWCDKCAEHVIADVETSVTELRRNLKDRGWKRVEVDKQAAGATVRTFEDRCPRCADEGAA